MPNITQHILSDPNFFPVNKFFFSAENTSDVEPEFIEKLEQAINQLIKENSTKMSNKDWEEIRFEKYRWLYKSKIRKINEDSFVVYGQGKKFIWDEKFNSREDGEEKPTETKIQLIEKNKITSETTAAIITTSSMEAVANNLHLDSRGISDIRFVSWHRGDAKVKYYDWSALKGVQVYYFLREHSGLGGKEVWPSARKVYNELKGCGIEIKFINGLTNGIGSSKPANVVPPSYNTTTYDEISNLKLKQFISFEEFSSRESPTEILMTPYLTRNSITAILGKSGSGRTFWGLCLAVALADGRKLFNGWNSRGNMPQVTFAYNTREQKIFWSQLKIIENIFRLRSRNSFKRQNPGMEYKEKTLNTIKEFPLYGDFDQMVNQLQCFTGTSDKVNSCKEILDLHSPPERVLFIDDVFDTEIDIGKLNLLLQHFKGVNLTVFLMLRLPENMKNKEYKVQNCKTALSTITIENFMLLKRYISDKDVIKFSVESSTGSQTSDRKIQCELNYVTPQLKKIGRKKQHLNEEEKMEKFKALYSLNQAGTISELANQAGISVYMANKFLKALGYPHPKHRINL